MKTKADEKRDEAREHVQDAIECLSDIVVAKCWGTDEYKPEYLNKLRKVFVDLIELREKF